CRTQHFPLIGAPKEPWDSFLPAETWRLRARYRLDDASARHLVQRYGRLAAKVAEYCQQDATLAQKVTAAEPDIQAEFAYQRDHEMAMRQEDHLLRRTRLGLFSRDAELNGSAGASPSRNRCDQALVQ